MKKRLSVGQSEFEALLNLLSEDREEAGERYECLRRGLLRFFRFKGCTGAVDLVDETFDRVATRADRYDPALSRHPEQFIYGFAALIALEHRRKAARQIPLDGFELSHPEPDGFHDDLERLEKCLERLDPAERELIREYYSAEGRERIDLRQQMYERLSITPSAIYVRIARIKEKLRRCLGRAVADET